MLAIDVETYDPNLKDLGDGSIRHDGKVLLVGVYDGNVYGWFEPESPILHDLLLSNEPKVFHNGIYDLSWLCCGYNLIVNGMLHDTMTRMTFINEYTDLDLDSCCKYFKLEGKNKADTIEAWFDTRAKAMGWKGTVWNYALDIWADPEGRDKMIQYNAQDCIATYNLFMAQEPYMKNFQKPYEVECRLYPLIIKMKKIGVRIDTAKLDELRDKIEHDKNACELELKTKYGIAGADIRSPKKMSEHMHRLDIHSPVSTASGKESWAADALDRINAPVIAHIQCYKNLDALLNKYLEGSLAKSLIKDEHGEYRIHCTFSPNKREDGGTITGRFACSKPNLQNIPARDMKHGQKSYGQEMRSLFLPEHGCMLGASDYSQIEYLLLAHFAQGPQADWFRGQANAGVDFHTVAMTATGITSRDVCKRLNYGIIYGMGIMKMLGINRPLFEKLAAAEHEDVEKFARDTYSQYHSRLPVIRDTMQYIQNIAKVQGYVIGIGGRWHRKPRPVYDRSTHKINDYIYKMTNYLIQGSAAEILKGALLKSWDDGLFDVLSPHITVHDENDYSIPYNKIGTDAAEQLVLNMNNSYKDVLKVPMKAETEVGPNWGYWENDIWNEMKAGQFNREVL